MLPIGSKAEVSSLHLPQPLEASDTCQCYKLRILLLHDKYIDDHLKDPIDSEVERARSLLCDILYHERDVHNYRIGHCLVWV